MKYLIFLNQKGGVGKTTGSINIAYGLAAAGKKVLLVDLCPQENSSGIFCTLDEDSKTIADLVLNPRQNIRETIYQACINEEEIKNLFVIPAPTFNEEDHEDKDEILDEAEQVITVKLQRERILSKHLKKIEKEFDYIVIDCRPTLGPLSENAIFVADLIIIPAEYSKFALDGIAALFRKIGKVKASDDYQYMILKNKRDGRNTITNDLVDSELEAFQDNTFKTVIRKCEALNQAQGYGETIYTYAPHSTGAEDYNNLVKEILNHG